MSFSRLTRSLLPASLLFCFAACRDDTTTTTDGGTTNNPDATTGNPDAATGNPDAATGNPDGSVNLACDPAFGAGPGCGNSVVGSWTYRGACGSTQVEDTAQQNCPGIVFQATSHVVTGSLDFAATTYTIDVTDVANVQANVPATCALAAGGCAGMQAALQAAGATQAVCAQAAGAACDCQLTITVAAAEAGTYATSGGVLTTMPMSGGSNTYNYCVEGGGFRYRETGDSVVYVLSP